MERANLIFTRVRAGADTGLPSRYTIAPPQTVGERSRMVWRRTFFLLPIIYLGFISLGLPDGALGVAWPSMHRTLGVPLGAAGWLVLVGTLLSALASFNSGRVIARFSTGPVVLISCALTGTGLLLISQARGLSWLVAAAVPLALGAGAVDAGLNSYVARHYSGRHMNWLHACWGIGATCGPLVMTQALGSTFGWRGGYAVLGSVQLGLAFVFLLTLSLWRDQPQIASTAPDRPPEGLRLPTAGANSTAGWISAGVFALYVAAETTTGVWANTVLVVARGVPQSSAGLCVALYYASITLGRILVGFFVDRWGNRRLVTLGLVLALLGAGLFTQAHSVMLAAPALTMIGLGFAPIYPCMMHEVPRRFAASAVATVIGRQSGASYLGGAVLPATVGWLTGHVSLESIAWIVLAGTVSLALVIRRLNQLT